MRHRCWLLYFSVLGLLFCLPGLAAKVCKRVDAEGQVYFGDCQGQVNEQELSIESDTNQSSDSPDTAVDRVSGAKLSDVMQADRLKRQQAREQAAADKAKQTRQCNQARDKLRSYKDAGHLYDLDKSGNRVILSQTQRQSAIADLEAAIKTNCH